MEKNIIFVDFFNTIISRKVSPNDIIYSWAKNVGKEFLIEPSLIYGLFKKISRKIAIKNKFKYWELEFKYVDCVNMLAKQLKRYYKELDLIEFVNKAYEIYINTEANSHIVNEKLIDKLREFKQSNKRLFVVSDFYCDSSAIKTWLSRFKIDDLFEKIYTSSECMCSKATGRMYKFLIKELKIKRNQVLMIGDNSYGDIFKAKLKGFSTLKIKNKYPKTNKETKIIIKNGANALEYEKIYEQFGETYNYSNYAFPLYLFTKRLYNRLKDENVKNVFFLSREGQFLKTLFDNYCRIVNEKCSEEYRIQTHYLYASRNSMQGATLKELKEEKFEFLFRAAIRLDVHDFLVSLSFSDDEIKLIEESLDIDTRKRFFKFQKSKHFKILKQNENFIKVYNNKKQSQNEALKKYFKEFNVDFKNEGLNIVDIGFNGTMQDFFNKFFQGDIKINGYYLASKKKGTNNSIKNGLLFDKYNKKQVGNAVHYHNKYYYEQICRADHGRVDGYAIEDGKSKIILDKKIPDNVSYLKVVKPLQEQILDKFEQIARIDYTNFSYIDVDATKIYYKLVKNKTRQDVDWLLSSQDCYHDNFAVVGFSMKGFKRKLRRVGFKLWDIKFLLTFALSIKALKFNFKKI